MVKKSTNKKTSDAQALGSEAIHQLKDFSEDDKDMENTIQEPIDLENTDRELASLEEDAREAGSSLTRRPEEEHAVVSSEEAHPVPRRVVSEGDIVIHIYESLSLTEATLNEGRDTKEKLAETSRAVDDIINSFF